MGFFRTPILMLNIWNIYAKYMENMEIMWVQKSRWSSLVRNSTVFCWRFFQLCENRNRAMQAASGWFPSAGLPERTALHKWLGGSRHVDMGPNSWMVCGKSHWNAWFGGTPILGTPHMLGMWIRANALFDLFELTSARRFLKLYITCSSLPISPKCCDD